MPWHWAAVAYAEPALLAPQRYAGAIGERDRRAVVEHVAEHHRRDDEEDERPLPVAGDPLQRVDDAVVEEDGDAAEDEERRSCP